MVILPVLVIAVLGLLFFSLQGKQKTVKREVLSSKSEDGQYTLTVFQIGDPAWPFGSTHCSIVLSQAGPGIAEHSFEVCNDGANVHAENFEVLWYPDHVSVTVSGAEQPDETYLFYYDASVNAVS